MNNSDRARIGALSPLMVAVGIITGAVARDAGWGLVAFMVFCQICLALWFLTRDDSDVTDER